ncbi:MAG: ATP synthase F1 subunit delta [Myxococcales bacterium]|nr:ATP synthase F1 subunit delta [Myxococcales bacterium]
MSIVAQRYANALFELAKEQDRLEDVDMQLKGLSELWRKSSSLRDVFSNPKFDAEQRRAIIDDIVNRVQGAVLVRNLLRLLSDRSRMKIIPALAVAFRRLTEARLGKVHAEVVSAVPLPEPYYDQLQQRLEHVTGKHVVIEKRVDPSVIAGVITRVGDRVFDGSAQGQLLQLREQLLGSQG